MENGVERHSLTPNCTQTPVKSGGDSPLFIAVCIAIAANIKKTNGNYHHGQERQMPEVHIEKAENSNSSSCERSFCRWTSFYFSIWIKKDR